MTERDLDRIFKAYDVRGVVPDDLDVDLVRAIGGAYAQITDDRPIDLNPFCSPRPDGPGPSFAY